jgi:hypothetical protein
MQLRVKCSIHYLYSTVTRQPWRKVLCVVLSSMEPREVLYFYFFGVAFLLLSDVQAHSNPAASVAVSAPKMNHHH